MSATVTTAAEHFTRIAQAMETPGFEGRLRDAAVAALGRDWWARCSPVTESWTIEHRGGRVMVHINAERVQVTELDRYGFEVTVTTFAGPDVLRPWALRGLRFAEALAEEVTP